MAKKKKNKPNYKQLTKTMGVIGDRPIICSNQNGVWVLSKKGIIKIA
jgi:hypothetical protein